jgi:hypothetical protein
MVIKKSLFDGHRKDKLPPEYQGMLDDMKEQVETYLDVRKNDPPFLISELGSV